MTSEHQEDELCVENIPVLGWSKDRWQSGRDGSGSDASLSLS